MGCRQEKTVSLKRRGRTAKGRDGRDNHVVTSSVRLDFLIWPVRRLKAQVLGERLDLDRHDLPLATSRDSDRLDFGHVNVGREELLGRGQVAKHSWKGEWEVVDVLGGGARFGKRCARGKSVVGRVGMRGGCEGFGGVENVWERRLS